MTVDQLTGRYFRLRKELAAAYGLVPCNTGHIDRLTDDLASIEREITAASVSRLRDVKAPFAYTESPRIWSH